MKKYILLIFFINFASAQVGINTTEPQANLDINGDLRIQNVPNGQSDDMVLVINSEGFVRKIPITAIYQGCPTLEVARSNPYYLLFTSNYPLSNYTEDKVISGLRFRSSGTWSSNGVNYYSYSNVSGSPLNLRDFSVTFGLNCRYSI